MSRVDDSIYQHTTGACDSAAGGARARCRAWSIAVAALLGLLSACPAGAQTAVSGLDQITINSAPVFVLFGAAPNLILTLDDSGSMNAAFLPDDIWLAGTVYESSGPSYTRKDTSHLTNLQYYNPAVVYLPPVRADGSTMDHSDFNHAWVDPLHRSWAQSSACTAQTSRTGSCSQDSSEDSCRLDLGSRYAAAWNLTNSHQAPCADLDATVLNRGFPIVAASQLFVYTIDPDAPDWPAFSDYAARQRPRWSAIRTGQEWAFRCLRDIDTGVAIRCPAFYHKFRPNGTYQDAGGITRNCADLNLRATRAGDFPDACLVRVEVGTAESILDLDKQDITANVIAKRRTLLQRSGELHSDSALSKRNFANWFSYYRTRFLSVQTVLSRVMKDMPVRPRIAYQGLTPGGYSPNDAAYKNLAATFAPYDATARQHFYNWLFGRRADASTFLISAALRTHSFCQSDQAYLEHPAAVLSGGQLTLVTQPNSVSNPTRGCRNNFHVIFTDGFWEDDGSMTRTTPPPAGKFNPPDWLANNDGVAHPLPAPGPRNAELGVPTTYDPASAVSFVFQDSEDITREGTTNVYADSNSGMLADVVFQSWIEDLRPTGLAGADDVVPPLLNTATGTIASQFWNPSNDLADWQHITTFTVGFGVAGNTDYPAGTWSWRSPQGTLSSGNIFTNGFPGAWNSIDSATTAPDYQQYSMIPMKIDDTWHAGINGHGGYLSARDPEGLTASFNRVLGVVAKVAGDSSAAAVSVNTASAAGSDLFYQARLSAADWSGDLRSYQISNGPGTQPCGDEVPVAGQFCQDAAAGEYYRSAVRQMATQAESGWVRRIFTAAGGVPIEFSVATWSRLTDLQRDDFLRGVTGYVGDPVLATTAQIDEAKARLNYVTGQRTYEADGQAYTFRKRTWLLGDLVNAGPVIVGAPAFSYRAPGYLAPVGATGAGYKIDHAGRTPLVYAGANDGMLHAFNAESLDELFAFIPPVLMGLAGDTRTTSPGLHLLSNPAYGSGTIPHQAYVDGPLAVGDARFGVASDGDWHTVLVAGLGMGAQALYALDVSEVPAIRAATSTIAASHYLWQITDRDDPTATGDHWDPDLGYVFGRPAIVRIRGASETDDPVWVAIVGNGYNSALNDGSRAAGCDAPEKDAISDTEGDGKALCGQAVLYVIDIQTGAIREKLETGVGRKDDPLYPAAAQAGSRRPNALGQATIVGNARHADGDRLAETAYAADLFGNLWRFDLTGQRSPRVKKLFSATTADVGETPGIPQPVTSPVAVARHPSGIGRLVLFGTGKYLAIDDVSDRQVQTFYAIWDQDTDIQPVVLRGELLEQSFTHTDIVTNSITGAAVTRGRTSSSSPIDWARHKGWYIDLDIEADPNHINKGERVVAEPRVQGNRITFVSLVPENNPCEGAGYGWINVLDLRSGSPFKSPPFDSNLDGVFSDADLLNVNGETAVATSLQFVGSDGLSTGIYSATTRNIGEGGRSTTVVSDSRGGLGAVNDSNAMQWRVWRQLP